MDISKLKDYLIEIVDNNKESFVESLNKLSKDEKLLHFEVVSFIFKNINNLEWTAEETYITAFLVKEYSNIIHHLEILESRLGEEVYLRDDKKSFPISTHKDTLFTNRVNTDVKYTYTKTMNENELHMYLNFRIKRYVTFLTERSPKRNSSNPMHNLTKLWEFKCNQSILQHLRYFEKKLPKDNTPKIRFEEKLKLAYEEYLKLPKAECR